MTDHLTPHRLPIRPTLLPQLLQLLMREATSRCGVLLGVGGAESSFYGYCGVGGRFEGEVDELGFE